MLARDRGWIASCTGWLFALAGDMLSSLCARLSAFSVARLTRRPQLASARDVFSSHGYADANITSALFSDSDRTQQVTFLDKDRGELGRHLLAGDVAGLSALRADPAAEHITQPFCPRSAKCTCDVSITISDLSSGNMTQFDPM